MDSDKINIEDKMTDIGKVNIISHLVITDADTGEIILKMRDITTFKRKDTDGKLD